MKRVKIKNGFTIVEVLLVLSISSLFAMMMMAGWSANIERQRYNDTVNTLKSDIQDIFNEVENPTNTRGLNIQCSDNGGDEVVVGATISRSGGNRGASDCVILGKLISFERNGGDKVVENKGRIYSYDVIGLDIDPSKACRGVCSTHRDAFAAAKYTIMLSGNSKEGEVQWSNSYIPHINGDANPALTGVLVMRSPIDGTVKAYSYRSRSDISKADKISDAMQLNDSRKVGLCVRRVAGGINDGSSASPFGRNRVVKIGNSGASVEIAPLDGDGSGWCDDGTVNNMRINL